MFVTWKLHLTVFLRNGWGSRFAARHYFVQEIYGPEDPPVLFSLDIGNLFAGLFHQLEILGDPDGQTNLQPAGAYSTG